MPMATGTPTIMAMIDVVRVPNSSAATPNTGGFPPGFHFSVVNSVHGLCAVSAGIAFQIRKAAIAAMISSRMAPDAADRPRKIRSPARTCRPVMPAASAVGNPDASSAPTSPALCARSSARLSTDCPARIVSSWSRRVPILGHRIGPAGGGHVGSVSVRVLMSEMVTHPAAQRPGASRN